MAVEEVDRYIEKMQKINESVRNRPNGVSAEDFVRRAMNTLGNCEKKMKAIKKMASKI